MLMNFTKGRRRIQMWLRQRRERMGRMGRM